MNMNSRAVENAGDEALLEVLSKTSTRSTNLAMTEQEREVLVFFINTLRRAKVKAFRTKTVHEWLVTMSESTKASTRIQVPERLLSARRLGRILAYKPNSRALGIADSVYNAGYILHTLKS